MHFIVQAGGRGSRLGYLTDNKPKGLVSIDNLPVIFHLFRRYPQADYTIIADYKLDVLSDYLSVFADGVEYRIVSSEGSTGTCAGIRKALKHIPPGQGFALVWSDLILDRALEIPFDGRNRIGVSCRMPCRWSYEGALLEKPSGEAGVVGLFTFPDKGFLEENVPESGEFVRWLQETGLEFIPFDVGETEEYGLLERVPLPEEGRCRPFNRLYTDNGLIVKEGIDRQGDELAVRERAWYSHVMGLGYRSIPRIHSICPLVMERINGRNVYAYEMSRRQKEDTLASIVGCLSDLHSLESCEADRDSIMMAYYEKTMSRLRKVRPLIPHSEEEYINVNGRECRNVFFNEGWVRDTVERMCCPGFRLIHGDCTFSNIMLRDGRDPVLLDPRGYFGRTEIMGDPLYDWAKLYYSLYGNYDQFNLRRFRLRIDGGIDLEIASNGWEDMSDVFFEMIPGSVGEKEVRLIHSLIWLSLTTYAWDDYDSICGAFYNGIYHMEDIS
ncbi:MAG: phosphotransferase [Gudongella sp.]|nr:phosphotransferase [Gudongella sp.]